MSAADTRRAIDAVWRIEQAKLIAGLARIVRDVGQAEELAQDALEAALKQWPQTGVPEKPGAWLMAAAKHRAIDFFRRRKLMERKTEEFARDIETEHDATAEIEAALDDDIGDDLLRLIFTSCHPVLGVEARVALTLRLLGGLTTDEIARAFLVPEATIAQRIVRAKKTLSEKRVPFEVPRGEDRSERLASVLEVIYLVFNEGYSATSGGDWMRPKIAEEAVRLGRVLAGLATDEAEVHGLVALMELQAARFPARTSPDGEPVLLLDQNRARWDGLMIRRGFAALDRGRAAVRDLAGPYLIQAEIAACHMRTLDAAKTDWARIANLYLALDALTPSPVVKLNRAVAIGMAEGPAAGLELINTLAGDQQLQGYHLLPAVRGDLLVKLGRFFEARTEFERAGSLTRNERERQLLLARAAACDVGAEASV